MSVVRLYHTVPYFLMLLGVTGVPEIDWLMKSVPVFVGFVGCGCLGGCIFLSVVYCSVHK